MPEFVAALIAIAVVCALIYGTFATLTADVWTMITVIIAAIILVPVFLYYAILQWPHSLRMHRFRAALPPNSPMKLDLCTEVIRAPRHIQRRCNVKNAHRLYVDLTISQTDWDAAEFAGLTNHVLFAIPDPKSIHSAHFAIGTIVHTRYADFADVQQLEAAKAELLNSLHILRTRIDAMKETIVQGKPRPTRESHEI
jgi:hypothetical protein